MVHIKTVFVFFVVCFTESTSFSPGLPLPNGDRHASEIASFAVDIARMVNGTGYSRPIHGEQLQLLIGISTGVKESFF